MLYAIVFVIGAIIGGAGVFILTRKKDPVAPKPTVPLSNAGQPMTPPAGMPTPSAGGMPGTMPPSSSAPSSGMPGMMNPTPPAGMPGTTNQMPPAGMSTPPANGNQTVPPPGGSLPRL